MACAHARWVGTGDGDVKEEAAVRTSPIDGQTRIRRLREGSGGQRGQWGGGQWSASTWGVETDAGVRDTQGETHAGGRCACGLR